MITFKYKGDLSKTQTFLTHAIKADYKRILDKYGEEGVKALAEATPKDTGQTAASWYYRIEHNASSISVIWFNSNRNNGVPIAIILQYGHGTGNGGYVKGIDYINPAMKPIFDEMARNAWKEVTGK